MSESDSPAEPFDEGPPAPSPVEEWEYRGNSVGPRAPVAGSPMELSDPVPGADARHRLLKPGDAAMAKALDEYEIYRRRAALFARRARRLTLSIIALGIATGVVGAFTAVADEALLGVLTGCLGAIAAGFETWRSRAKWELKATAYDSAQLQLDHEIDLFWANGKHYGEISDQTASEEEAHALKLRRLTENRVSIDKALRDSLN